MSGFFDIIKGVSAETDANRDAQLIKALDVISLVGAYLPLQEECSAALNQDAGDIYDASMKVPGRPEASALVASAVENRDKDAAMCDLRTGNFNALIQSQETVMNLLTTAMMKVFSQIDPLARMMHTLVSSIAQPMR